MQRRIVLLALVAVVIGAGYGSWHMHISAVVARLDMQAAQVRALLGRGRDPQEIAALVQTNDVRVVLGPPGMAASSPPLGAPPIPPPKPDRASPAMRAPQPSWFARTIADVAHIRPRVVHDDGVVIGLLPSAEALTTWFAIDVAICVALIATIALYGWRAQRAEAVRVAKALAAREAAAAEFKRFLADAGHELRTPLTIIAGYIDILEAYGPTERQAHVLDGMREASARMRTLVEKMLLLSRLESLTPVASRVSVAQVADEVVDALRHQFPKRELLAACESDAHVEIDRDDLYEALRNLVENALRYAPDSPVRIEAHVRNDGVEIVVSDRGPGIAFEEQGLVFERFYRGAQRTGPDGSGLGLAIVKRVVDRWNGNVTLQSSADGTRFTLRFLRAVGI